MAKLYFDFKTNIEHRNKEHSAPQLDELVFKTKEGNMLYISCDGESDFELKDGTLFLLY